jgi:hypothetical protein
MKLPKTVLLNLKMSAKNAERSPSQFSFYPRWILPLKLLVIFLMLIYVTGFFYYQNLLNEFRIKLILDLLLSLVIIFPLLAFLKNLVMSFIENLRVKSVRISGFSPPVSVLLILGNDKQQNLKSIRSVLESNFPKFEIILLSNSEEKYSNVNKEIIGLKKKPGTEIKISLLHSKNTDQINLIKTGLKICLSKYIVLLKPNMVVEKNTLMFAMKHFSNHLTSVVVGKYNLAKSRSMFQNIFAVNDFIDSHFLRAKNGIEKTNFISSNSLIAFKNEKNSGIEFISLGEHKQLTLMASNNDSSKIIYDSDIKLKEAKKENENRFINNVLENELLKFDELIQQWNILYLKNRSTFKRLKLDWQIFKFIFFPVFQLVVGFILFFTAAATANFEYLFYWVIFISVINIFKTVFSVALDYSILKYILTSLLFKWITDLVKVLLKVFSFNKLILLNSLNYVRLKN